MKAETGAEKPRFFLRDGYGTFYAGDTADEAMDRFIDAAAACLAELAAGASFDAREFALVRIDLSDAEVAALPAGETPLVPQKLPRLTERKAA